MSVRSVTEQEFEETVLRAQKPVLVDFYAEWCGPCGKIEPVIEELSRKHPDVLFTAVDVEHAAALAERYHIDAIPALLLFRDGKVANRTVGLRPKHEIEMMIS